MDVLFNEADLDYPGDDLLLTDAIRRSARVVLPVLRRGYGPVSNQTDLPWPAFADAAGRPGPRACGARQRWRGAQPVPAGRPGGRPLAPLEHRAAVRGRPSICGRLRALACQRIGYQPLATQ